MILYLLNASSTTLYKIGITENIGNRIKQLSTGSGYELSVTHIYETEYAREIEGMLHRHYEPIRSNLEWFDFVNTPIEEVKEKILKFEEIVKVLNEKENCD